LIDEKFKLSVGVHLPTLQINMDDDSVDHFIAQELIASFPISEKISLSTMYIHGKGKNVDLEINLITFNANYVKNKFRYLS